MAQLKQNYLLIIIAALFLGIYVFSDRSPRPVDLHSQIQQRVLEAEYGSATTFRFASQPGIVSTTTESSESLVDKLQSMRPDIRWFAAGELAKRKDSRAVEYIIRAMRDPADTVRVCVMAQALGRIKDPRALGPLSAAAFDSTNRDLRLCAIQSLGMLGDPRAVPKLIEALETRNMPVAAASALARIGDERGVQPIITAATTDKELAMWMARALGELGSASALPYLHETGNIDKPLTREITAHAIWKISRLSDKEQVIQLLVATLLTDSNKKHRAWAAFKLGELQNSKAIPGLLQALNDSDEEVSDRVAAALIRIGNPSLNPLRTQLSQQATTQAYKYAVAIIAYIGDQTDIEKLNNITNSTTTEIAHIADTSIRILQQEPHYSEELDSAELSL